MATKPPKHPITSAAIVSPGNTTDLPSPTRALFVGGTGDVKVQFVDDPAPVTLESVPAGCYGWSVRRVYLTGTTATKTVALK